MSVHHLIRESNIKDVCPYCGRNVENKVWNSRFWLNTMYKELRCSCGHKLSVKMPFISSGDEKSKKLDEKIEECV